MSWCTAPVEGLRLSVKCRELRQVVLVLYLGPDPVSVSNVQANACSCCFCCCSSTVSLCYWFWCSSILAVVGLVTVLAFSSPILLRAGLFTPNVPLYDKYIVPCSVFHPLYRIPVHARAFISVHVHTWKPFNFDVMLRSLQRSYKQNCQYAAICQPRLHTNFSITSVYIPRDILNSRKYHSWLFYVKTSLAGHFSFFHFFFRTAVTLFREEPYVSSRNKVKN